MDLPFEYISCLGHGSFGVVLQAKGTTGSHFAVKIIFPSEKPEESKYLKREYEITKGKDHPNIVKIINVLETVFTTIAEFDKIALLIDDDEIHDQLDIYMGRIRRKKTIPVILIEMELCGVTLREWLHQHVNHDKEDLSLQLTQVNIIKDITNGMQFLHENKIIHRDFKPENVMFSAHENTKLALPLKIGDFGLCRVLHTEASRYSELTSKIGTLDYRAPEMDGNNYNFQSDIFSLGLVIWEVADLIPFKNKKIMFSNLIFDEQKDLIVSFLPIITSTILSMTKRKIVDRMKSIIDAGEAFDNPISEFMFEVNKRAAEIVLLLPYKYISCLRHGFFGIVLKNNTNGSHSKVIKSLKYQIIKEKNRQNSPDVYQTVFTKYVNVNELEKIAKLVNQDIINLKGTIRRKLPGILAQKKLFNATLRKWLVEHVSHDKKDVALQLAQVKIIQDIVNGMQFLHENKIIHRDFKPENIMFSHNEYKFSFPLKIGNFGLCQILHSKESRTSTLSSRTGTFDYRAPEMDDEYDLQSDIYSLGLVIWEVVHLLPFKGRKKLFNELVYDDKTKLVVEPSTLKIRFPVLRRPFKFYCRLESSISSTIISMTKRKLEERMKSIIEVEEIKDSPITLFKGQLVQLAPTTVRNGQELKDILLKCSKGDIINLTEGEFYGPFKINCSNLKIIGQGSKTVLKCHAKEEIPIEICGNNNCVSNIVIHYTSDGVELVGSDNSIFNVGLIVNGNYGSTALMIEGSRNKISGLKISKSVSFLRKDWMNKPYGRGIFSNGDYNTLENIEINGLSYGIVLYDSNSTVTNVIINNTIDGISIFGSQNKISTIKYIRGNSFNMNRNECSGVRVHNSENDFEDIQCTEMGDEEWGFCISSHSAKKCKISNSSCGPLLIDGSEHTLINVDCGLSIELIGMGYKLIKCKGKQLLKDSRHSQTFVLEDNNFDQVGDF